MTRSSAVFCVCTLGGLCATAGAADVELTASDAQAGDRFGHAVAASATTLLVGAPGEDAGGTDAGAVYVLVRSGTSWAEQAKLVAGDPAADQAFGTSVALEGDRALVGAPGDAADTGAVYVFVRSGTVWTQEAKLASISDPPVVRRILRHLDLPAEPPALAPPRAPPQLTFGF